MMQYREEEIHLHKITYYYRPGKNNSVIVMLHGLFGALSNFEPLITLISEDYEIAMPNLPLYDIDVAQANIEGITTFLEKFLQLPLFTNKNIILLGNSFGGHIALNYQLKSTSPYIKALVLTGSSGLFENFFGSNRPSRKDDFIQKRIEDTFFDPKFATSEVFSQVKQIISNNKTLKRLLSLARSATKTNLQLDLPKINIPVLLIWGCQDKITPVSIGQNFHKNLPNSVLKLIDKAGHAPMIEKPKEFYHHLNEFLLSL
ncbi:MAG: alpha/beta hydrolase [Chitinophagales bacterium]|jgi:pimeloyl-ACP methyl ester carboxylesterase|nr:alpha/beta hydrolase [Chitinophagales bacterium]